MIRIGDYAVSVRRADNGLGWSAEVILSRRFSDVPLHIASLSGYGSEEEAETAGRAEVYKDMQRVLTNLERALATERSAQ
jgi:hypothetical protein